MDDRSSVVVDAVSGVLMGAVTDLLGGQSQPRKEHELIARTKVQMRVAMDDKFGGDIGIDPDLPVLLLEMVQRSVVITVAEKCLLFAMVGHST